MPHPPCILPEPYRPPTREQIERARAMYLEKFTVSRILGQCDMSLGTFYHWLDGGPAENGVPLYPPIPRRRVVVGRRQAPLCVDRVSLTSRLWRTAEVAFARQCAMYLANVVLGQSYSSIGRLFRRDRTTATYACQLVKDLRDDPALDRLLQTLEDLCDDLARGILSRPQVRP